MEKRTIRNWRKVKGYSTDFVADKLGIKKETLNKKERENEFSIHQIRILCELFQINVNQIA